MDFFFVTESFFRKVFLASYDSSYETLCFLSLLSHPTNTDVKMKLFLYRCFFSDVSFISDICVLSVIDIFKLLSSALDFISGYTIDISELFCILNCLWANHNYSCILFCTQLNKSASKYFFCQMKNKSNHIFLFA